MKDISINILCIIKQNCCLNFRHHKYIHNTSFLYVFLLQPKLKISLLTFYAKINVFTNFFFQKTKCASNRSNLPVDMLEMVEWQNDTSLKINHWKEGCSIDLWTKCILIGGNQVKFTVSKLGPDCLCACYGK